MASELARQIAKVDSLSLSSRALSSERPSLNSSSVTIKDVMDAWRAIVDPAPVSTRRVQVSYSPGSSQAKLEFFRLISPGYESLEFSTSMSKAQLAEFRDNLGQIVVAMPNGGCDGSG